jgi:hypothetical protein
LGTSNTNYNWFDATPVNGNNFYRIALVEKDGQVKYTQTVKVILGKVAAEISIYPNPVLGNQFSLQMNNMKPGSYTLTLFNKLGQHVFTKIIQNNSSSFTQTIELSNLVSGVYQVRLYGEGINFVQQVIKE